MANTSAQHIAEQWVVSQFLCNHFSGVKFVGRKLSLRWGGRFAFDAVSEDEKLVGLVSTSAAHTAGRKAATAKFQKLKADALYLLHVVGAERLFMIFTEESMLRHFEKEKKSGRFPPEIELIHAPLPEQINAQVLSARKLASAETAPQGVAHFFYPC